MYTVDCSIKEVDKLNIFNINKRFNLPAILHSIKSYEQNFYAENEKYTKRAEFPLIEGLKGKIESKTITTRDKIRIDILDINPFHCKKYIIFCEGISSEKTNPLQQKAYLKLIYAGWGVIAFDYRGRGKSSGQFSQDGARTDIAAIYKYLLNKGIMPKDIGIIGHSMGSAIAADFSSKHTIAFTILINPFSKATDMVKKIAQKASMPDFIRRIIQQLPAFLIPLQNKFDNERAIKKIHAPVYIIHTKDDGIIPVELARKLSNIKAKNNILYTELNGSDHDLNDEKIEYCLKFMEKHL